MKLLTISVGFFMLLFSDFLFAQAGCDIRASLVDIRDSAITFDPTLEHTFRSVFGGPECKMGIRATNLANPRSSITQNFSEPRDIMAFTQRIEISNISLRGVGELKFMSVDFDSHNDTTSRLDLFISPGVIGRGQTEAGNYYVTGQWFNFASDGTQLPGSYFSTPLIANLAPISLKWEYVDDRLFPGMKLGLDLGNSNYIPISRYPQAGVPWGATWGQQPFYPTAKTIGSLAQTSLVPQTSFTLKGGALCDRSVGTPNLGCD